MDAVHRMCSVKAFAGNQVVLLHITFPGNYPNGNAPSFQFVPGSTVDIVVKTKLLKLLKYTAQQRVLRNRSCLEPCLRQLVIALEKVSEPQCGLHIIRNILPMYLVKFRCYCWMMMMIPSKSIS